jgi:hypothetical protein
MLGRRVRQTHTLARVPTSAVSRRRFVPSLARPLAFEPAFVFFFVFLDDFAAIGSVDPEIVIKKNGQ